MKKIILALVALAFAFAISSCCDQSYCPGNWQCGDRNMRQDDDGSYRRRGGQNGETPYRWDTQGNQEQQGQERQHRRW
jgi:hypothetical protein